MKDQREPIAPDEASGVASAEAPGEPIAAGELIAPGEPIAPGELTWEAFEALLAVALARMQPETFLIIAAPSLEGEGAGRYVQFANGGRQGFRAEASGNHYLGEALTR